MHMVRGFGRFWWDFIVGDDPMLAVGVIVTLAVAYVLNQNGLALAASFVGPIGTLGVLALSLVRATWTDGNAG